MKQNQVKEHFARQAEEYDELMAKIIPQYREQHRIISSLLPKEDKYYQVLDLGCANGVLSELVLRKLPQSHVAGFDLTEEMLTAYSQRLSAFAGRFEAKHGDFRMDSIGEGYDIILAGLTLHHLTWEQREEFYETLYSSLNEGGVLITRDIILDEDQQIVQDQYGHWKEFMAAQGEDPEFWFSKHIEKDYPVRLSDHFTWLRGAGFSKVACQWRLFNFAITTAEKPGIDGYSPA